MQHVVRNVTTVLESWVRRVDVWILAAAMVAVPLLAILQYRWLSDLSAAQGTELRQAWEQAVALSAADVDSDLSAFYAAILEIGRTQADPEGIADAVTTWRGAASTIGALARVYIRERDSGRWLRVVGLAPAMADEPLAALDDMESGVPFSATWISRSGIQTLPALFVKLDGRSGIDGVLLTFPPDACQQLLRVLAERHFDFDSDARLAILEGTPTRRSICAHGLFDEERRYEARTGLFRLRPRPLAPSRGDSSGGSAGVVMSQGVRGAIWNLHAQEGLEGVGARVRRAQALNLWMAAGLELTLVMAIIASAVGARRARKTATEHMKFSAVVAHELRTPLAAIKILGQNQARGIVRRDEHVIEYGHTIAAEADRLHGFVERVLQFTGGVNSSSRAAHLQAVDLERVVATALEPLREHIGSSEVKVHAKVEPEARTICGDEDALVMAVRNLVRNALDHADGVRTIDISARRRERYVAISVSDDGAGVPLPERTSLFEPFVRGSAPIQSGVQGHGLGLAIVHDVARAHGGRAWYEPQSTGSVFTLTVLARTTECH